MKKRIYKKYKTRKKGGQHYIVNYGFFTPAKRTEPEELIAFKRFGHQNIKNLPKIGSGSDRDVYALGKDKVLKIAKNVRGISQNLEENELSSAVIPEELKLDVFETGKDYVIAERAEKADKSVKEFLKPLKQFSQEDFDKKTSKLQDTMNSSGLGDYMNYDILWNDFKAPRNWGKIRGSPSLIDGGALSSRSLGTFNTQTRKYEQPKFIKDEWDEIKRERSILRRKQQ